MRKTKPQQVLKLLPLIPTILPVRKSSQRSSSWVPRFFVVDPSRYRTILNPQENPNLLHKSTRSRLWFTASRIERYRSNVQPLSEWSHTHSSMNCNLMEDDDLVKNNPLIQILQPIWIPKSLSKLFHFLTGFSLAYNNKAHCYL
jgi:hypothetical protein